MKRILISTLLYLIFVVNTFSQICAPPTGLQSTNVNLTSATVSWNNASGVSQYILQYKPSSASTWTTVNTPVNSYNLMNLTSNTQYTYQVMAECTNSSSSAYSIASIFTTASATCAVPTNVAISNIGYNTALVSWEAVVGASNYEVQYKLQSATTWQTFITSNISFSLSNISSLSTYNVRVKTNCNGGFSVFSNTINFNTLAPPCGTPTNVAISNIGNNSAQVAWAPVVGATNYEIQYKLQSALIWQTISTTNTTLSLSGLSQWSTYNIKVRANCSLGIGVFSNTINFTTIGVCAAPTNLNATMITNSSAILSWQGNPGSTRYRIQYKPTSSTTWLLVTTTSTSITINNLTAGTNYQYQAMSECTNNSTTSGYSPASAFTTTNITTCQTPINLAATAITPSSAILNWSAVIGASGYTVQYKKLNATDWTTVNVTTNSYSLSNLIPLTTYSFKVKTVCPSLPSTYSAQVNFITIGVCTSPTGLTAKKITNNSASISWNSVPGASKYNLQVRPINLPIWSTYPTTTNSKVLTGLLKNTTYQYQVMSECTNSSSSGYGPIMQFNTLNNCDDAEINDIKSQAKQIIILPNFTKNINIDYSGDIDWYFFTSNTVSPYFRISLTGLPTDIDLQLINSTGNVLATSNQSGIVNEEILYTAVNNNNLFIKVFGKTASNFSPSSCFTLFCQNSGNPFRINQASTDKSSLNNNKYSIYPNPNNGQFILDLGSDNFSGNIEILDIVGSVVYQEMINSTGSTIPLHLDKLESGVYFVRINDGINSQTINFVIER